MHERRLRTRLEAEARAEAALDHNQRERLRALAQGPPLQALALGLMADRVVERTDLYRRRHFFVVTHSPGRRYAPPSDLAFTWQSKNCFGITFERNERVEARDWAFAALRQGRRVFICPRKGANGGGFGRALADGVYAEDEARLWREAEALGLVQRVEA
jgi:hypothetical protein